MTDHNNLIIRHDIFLMITTCKISYDTFLVLFLVDKGEVINDDAVSAEVDEHVDDLLESPIPESIESLFEMAFRV